MTSSLLKEAREIIRCQPRTDKTAWLGRCVEQFDDAWRAVCVTPSRENLVSLNSTSCRLIRAMDDVTAATPPPHLGGAVRLDKEQLAA